jgi:hypothetical protein
MFTFFGQQTKKMDKASTGIGRWKFRIKPRIGKLKDEDRFGYQHMDEKNVKAGQFFIFS